MKLCGRTSDHDAMGRRIDPSWYGQVRSGQVSVFNVHIQSKLLQHTPVMGTHSSYQLGCQSRTDG